MYEGWEAKTRSARVACGIAQEKQNHCVQASQQMPPLTEPPQAWHSHNGIDATADRATADRAFTAFPLRFVAFLGIAALHSMSQTGSRAVGQYRHV